MPVLQREEDPPDCEIDRTSPGLRFVAMDFSAHSIIWVLLAGLVIGAIAKLLMPGRDPGGCIITMLLGVAGAFVGTWLGKMFTGNDNYTAHWIMSIVGAMLLLLLYRMVAGRRS
jgi:uncharacterized membrane protein YeaQ/YmgE (transglycosylase-associated protein family)